MHWTLIQPWFWRVWLRSWSMAQSWFLQNKSNYLCLLFDNTLMLFFCPLSSKHKNLPSYFLKVNCVPVTQRVPYDPEKLSLEVDPPLRMGVLPLEFINIGAVHKRWHNLLAVFDTPFPHVGFLPWFTILLPYNISQYRNLRTPSLLKYSNVFYGKKERESNSWIHWIEGICLYFQSHQPKFTSRFQPLGGGCSFMVYQHTAPKSGVHL